MPKILLLSCQMKEKIDISARIIVLGLNFEYNQF